MSASIDGQRYLRADLRWARRITPNMVRVCLGGGELGRFVATEYPDQRILLAFPRPGESDSPPPVGAGGVGGYPDEGTRPPIRSYTVRAWDPVACELLVDFALHAHGPAAQWATRAVERTAWAGRPGRRESAGDGDTPALYVLADVGWYRPPADTSWRLLIADMAGLPALDRIVETVPDPGPTRVIVEVIEPDDVPRWELRPTVTVHPIVGGNGLGPSALELAAAEFEPPPGPGYVWSATEAGVARAIRRQARTGWGLANSRFDIVGYWRIDQDVWLARYRLMGARLEAVWENAIADGRSEDDAAQIYDEALERAGL